MMSASSGALSRPRKSMAKMLAQTLFGLNGESCLYAPLHGKRWVLFFPADRSAAGDAARAIRPLREKVRARGRGFAQLKCVWRGEGGLLSGEYALLAFGMGRRAALRLADGCGRFFVAAREGDSRPKIFAPGGAPEGEAAAQGAQPQLVAVYLVEPPRPSYFRTREVFLPVFRRGKGA